MRLNDYNTIFMFFLTFKKIDRYKVRYRAAYITTNIISDKHLYDAFSFGTFLP